jgi:predicted phosphodiesterase
VIGVFSDSHGDLEAFDTAFEVLKAKGVRRFIFAGGDYQDMDDWFYFRRDRVRASRDYTDEDFLQDVRTWLAHGEQVERPPAFWGHAEVQRALEDELVKVRERFVRVCEKDTKLGTESPGLRKAMDMIGDTLCCVIHDKNDLERDDLINCNLIIHGKEPEGKVVQIGPRYFVTPGRLRGGNTPSCALIEKVEKNLKVTILGLDGQTLVEGQVLQMSRSNKISVK